MIFFSNFKHGKYRWIGSFSALLFLSDLASADVPNNQSKTQVKLKAADLSKKKKVSEQEEPSDRMQEKFALDEANALYEAKLKVELSVIRAKIEQLRAEIEYSRLRKQQEEDQASEQHIQALREMRMEKELLLAQLELSQTRLLKELEQHHIAMVQLEKQLQVMRGETQLLQQKKDKLDAEVAAFQADQARAKHIARTPIYLKNPLRKSDNLLILSDRCIELNGHIMPWSADYIIDRIEFFNNKNSSQPIFLVIGCSPGGSVLAGYRILQTMRASRAPVYVVVKNFAASMAAIIATLATKSYAYPNAQILHHQPLQWGCGVKNVRELREQYKELYAVWSRLGGAVAKKMGISLKEFEQKLYKHSMYGDWCEYSDKAAKLKWVDCVISGVQNSAINELPDRANYNWHSYIATYYHADKETEAQQLAEIERAYYAHATKDFDYSFHCNKQQALKK